MNEIQQKLVDDLSNASSIKEVEEIRVRYLGKKGLLTLQWKNADFKSMSPDERKNFGVQFNKIKTSAEAQIHEAMENLQAAGSRTIDVDATLPGTDRRVGCIHPITLIQMELEEIFHGMGFRVLAGNDVEEEFYNFDALNIPADHPARETQDTFWLTNGMLLRTHTSAYQVRAMEQHGVPLRAIFPGRCFRYESVDASHENTFYQLEGLMVDDDISIANLIAVMKTLLSEIFRKDVTVRLRPGFFPFVEPGFELDCQCLICEGKGCATCKNTGWIELIPCGLVHPKVLEYGGIDSKKYSGFAFGLGLTRLAMMKFGIPEIRLFNSGDIRFYQQFPASGSI